MIDKTKIRPEEMQELLGSLRYMLEKMLGRDQLLDFGSANFLGFNATMYVPASTIESEMGKAVKRVIKPSWRDRLRLNKELTLEEVMISMVRRETTLETKNRDLVCFPGSTRVALGYLFNRFSKDGKSIAIPVPNWHFWNMKEASSENVPFTYFNGENENQLIENFDRTTKANNIGAVVLSAPTTPLGHDLSEKTVREIDKIAQRKGVAVIIDDVLRGTRDANCKDSIGRWVEEPYVAEGLTHRFGNGIGDLSYVLFPGKKPTSLKKSVRIANSTAPLVELILKYSSQPAVNEIKARNEAFDKGLKATAPETVITYRPFKSSLTTLVTLPEDYPIDGKEFTSRLYEKDSIITAPIEVFYPSEHEVAPELRRSFRITVGRIPTMHLEKAASKLGQALKRESEL